jgi:LuxR family maltose regulon positive regulatory protein
MPRFSAALAVEITGDPQAGRRIEELYRRRLFVDRRSGPGSTYQYHDLFRAFLCARAQEIYSAQALTQLSARAAELLLAAGLDEDAFELFVQAHDWLRAERILLDNARNMIAQGRWQSLEEWAAALPQERIAGNSSVQYWLGRSKTLVDATGARELQEQAYRLFLEQGNSTGELLTSTAVLEALHFEVLGFKPRELWLGRLAHALKFGAQGLCFDDDLWVHATLMSAATHCSPDHPMLAPALEKVKHLLPSCSNVNLKVTVANMLHYSGVTLLDSEAVSIATREARAVLKSPELTADARAMYHIAEGLSYGGFGRYREAVASFRAADAVIDQHSLTNRIAFAGVWRGLCERRLGDLAAAEATIARSEQARAADDGFASFMLDQLRALVAFDRGDRAHGIAIGLAALERCDQSGLVITMMQNRIDNAYMLIDAGRAGEGLTLLEPLEGQRALLEAAPYGGSLAFLQAWAAQQDICPSDALKLSKAMTFASDERHRVRMRKFPRALADRLPIALEQGIKPDMARLFIVECKLEPPKNVPESWPWLVRIHTLGRFDLLVNEKPVLFGHKAPKRTLALLKALIASGGLNVRDNLLLDLLCPELEGERAYKALSAALHRIRRLLPSPHWCSWPSSGSSAIR